MCERWHEHRQRTRPDRAHVADVKRSLCVGMARRPVVFASAILIPLSRINLRGERRAFAANDRAAEKLRCVFHEGTYRNIRGIVLRITVIACDERRCWPVLDDPGEVDQAYRIRLHTLFGRIMDF